MTIHINCITAHPLHFYLSFSVHFYIVLSLSSSISRKRLKSKKMYNVIMFTTYTQLLQTDAANENEQRLRILYCT